MFSSTQPGKTLSLIFILLCVVAFSTLTVYLQVTALDKSFMYYLEQGLQIQRHTDVLQGTAPNPWQYRILADYLVEGVIQLFRNLDVSHPLASAFIAFRFVQNLLIFGLAYLYYRRLNIPAAHALLGLSVLAWGMTYANYDSDLQFNTYFDIIFYLLAGLIVLAKKPLWLIPLMVFAALNRETSGLIPFLALALVLPWGQATEKRKVLLPAAISLAIFAVVFVSLRLIYPHQTLSVPHGQHMGLELLRYNLFRAITWIQLFATLGIIPVLALLAYKKWPQPLTVFFWVVVPLWLLIHPITSVMAESRVFLVPQVLIFIPGALFLLKSE
jgi:hypothetical protein